MPGPPTSLRVQARSRSILISWTPPLDDGVMIRGYLIGWGINVPEVHQKKVDGNQRYFTIEALKPSRDYVVSLKAYNRVGNGFPIYETVRTLETELDGLMGETEAAAAAAGGAARLLPTPIGLRALTVSSSAIRLSWTDTDLPLGPPNLFAPPNRHRDGRSYTIRYTNYYASDRRYRYVNASETSYMVDGLEPNTQYEFSIRAVLRRRSSPWSMAALNMTETAAPSSAPTDLTAIRGDRNDPLTVLLNWQPPEHANGQIIGQLQLIPQVSNVIVSLLTDLVL